MRRQRGDILFTLIIYAVILAAVCGAIYGVYKWIDTSWETSAGIKRGEKDKQAEWDKAVADQRAAEAAQAATAVTKLGEGNAKARVVYRTITQSVDRYVDRPVYRSLCVDDDGMRDVRRAIVGSESAPPGRPDKPVPTAARPDGRTGGDGPAVDDKGR